MIRAMRQRPDAPWVAVFTGLSFTFLFGAVAFVIFPLAGLAVWAFGVTTLVRRIRFARDARAARAVAARKRAIWDARWASWGGRLTD